MSLAVWLPLNGDLHNQGLSNVTVTNNGATINNSGKIGKCYSFNGSSNYLRFQYPASNLQGQFSFCCWLKLNNRVLHTLISSRKDVGYGFSVFVLSTGQIRFDNGTDNTVISQTIFNTVLPLNTWQHIAIIQTSTLRQLYINGILKESIAAVPVTSGNTAQYMMIGACSSNDTAPPTGNFLAGYLNDIRIYNHALSSKEIEEISKGLVLHYKLDNYWLAKNLLINTHFDSRLSQTTGWDTSKNGTLVANDWGGYNSGVANQATVYHAHLKEVNGEYVYEFIKDENNQWLGISQSGIQSKLTAGTKYTFSWEQYCVSGSNYVKTGLYYYKTGASSAGFHLGYGYGNSGRVIGQWQKFTYTFTAPSDADYSKTMYWYVYGNSGGNGTFYTRHFKLEKGDKATPWCPAKSDTLYTILGYNNTTIYDSSGYSNNGTIIGDLSAAAPSPRYDVATQFPGNALIEAEPLPAETKTISAWIKWNSIPSGTGSSSYTIPLHDKNSGLAIGVYNDGKALISYVGSAAGGAGSNVSCSITTNTWYHIVVVKTGDTTRDVYINNVKQSPITNNYWGGNMAKFHIGGRHLGGSYSAYLNGQIVDVRAYATALSAQQIKELYTTSMQIDSSGNVFARELVEL